MTEIEENIKNVKDLSLTAVNQLKKEEERYNEELESFKDKLERWENRPTYSASKPQFKRPAVNTQANICKEAQDFMDFVAATGGHENGWSADDHALFLKVKNKTKDPRRVAEIIHMLLPDISEEAVVAHEKWYETYLDLKEKQKEAIKHWRTNKMSNKQISSAIERAAPDQCTLRKSFSASGEKGEVEQKLVAWKKEKILKTEYEKEQKRQELAKQKELEELKKQKQEELRLQVHNWRLSKNKAERDELYKKQEEEVKEQKERALKANKLIKQFQCQDEIFIQNKLQMMQPQKKVSPVIKKRESYPRDPLRLLKPTQQWIMRTHAEKKDSGSFTNHANLQEIQKLGLPEWRKCIY
ncbi:coiled-coil domain-containing protein 112-like [Photinus pyralis]|nr:coiled-coil domain-containing protein 112-like [Photinus pyralis]